ncbi:hypothetical protein B0H63DRAFT_181543 [Podospora didyma]|uniref:Uncharacterized protein n=1 Tax=Podospora didyma TaxID=330526 RepID=A0AAE0NPH2_9PEZI|nr:hypothetical protein B0H63DRAFT_181543 [Podospora didyma]
MLFTCLELMQGRYKTGKTHLQSGMKLLADLTDSKREYTNDWLVGAFTRMNLLATQFGQGLQTPPGPQLPTHSQPLSSMLVFESVSQARDYLDYLLADILHLADTCRQQTDFQDSVQRSSPGQDMLDIQRIKSDLASWLHIYRESSVRLHTQKRPLNEIAFHLQVQAFHQLKDPAYVVSGTEQFFFVADIGWVPPLHYTALHCRVRHIRQRAIDLLQAVPIHEGVWDSVFAASVATEVMRIEQGGVVENCDAWVGNNDLPTVHPELVFQDDEESLNLPTAPALHRLYDVQVTLSDSPTGKATLSYKKGTSDGRFRITTTEYDVSPEAGLIIKKDVDFSNQFPLESFHEFTKSTI